MLKRNIADSFTRIEKYLTFTNAIGYTDFNSDAERFFIEILDTTYDYRLKELNAEKPNFPAIDLADNRQRICIQVTTTGDNAKFRDTLAVYKRNGFNEKYDELIFLILSTDHRITATDNKVKTRILSLKDLFKDIGALKDKDIEYIDSYLKDYLREQNASDNSPKHGITYTLGSAKKFIKWSNIEDEDILKSDLKLFAEKLSELTNNQRSYLHFLVTKGHTPTTRSYHDRSDHIVVPSALERAHYGAEGNDIYNSLKAEDLVVLDDEYDQNDDERYVTALMPRYRGETEDFNLFAQIKNFLKADVSKLRRVFINCDFSCLD